MVYIYTRYIQSFATPKSEALASDSVLNLGWDSRRLRFPGFVLAFSTAFLEGRARRAPTGALPCAHLGVSRRRRARRPRTRRIFAGARRHGGFISFGPGDLFRCCCSEELICDILDLSFFQSEVRSLGLADASAFSRLPCCAGRHRPDRPPRSCLTRWLPSLAPLSSRGDCTRLLGVSHRSWYQIVAYPGYLFGVS